MFKYYPLIVVAAAASLSVLVGQAVAVPSASCRITPHDLPPPAVPDGTDVLAAGGSWHVGYRYFRLPDDSILSVNYDACDSSDTDLYVWSTWVIPHCESQLNCELTDKIVALANMVIGGTPLADKIDDLKRELAEHGLEPYHAERDEKMVRVKTILEHADEDVGFFEFWYQDQWAPLLYVIGFGIRSEMAIVE